MPLVCQGQPQERKLLVKARECTFASGLNFDFFLVKDDMVEPPCEKLVMLLQQEMQIMYLCVDSVSENQNLAKKMKVRTGD